MSKVSEGIEIDGSQGEGGGQILRTALALSACRGVPVHIRNIRQGRQNPGLMRQHLACVKAIADVCGADVKGAFIGATALAFTPGPIRAGDYRFAVGTAGSSTLVFQTVLPALLMIGQPSRLTLVGGTHNPMAPSFDFIEQAFLPILRQQGGEFSCQLHRYGFYPVGAGEWTVTVKPAAAYRRLCLETRGELVTAHARCLSAKIPGHIVVREKDRLLRRLKWPEESISTAQIDSLGPGNSVIVQMDYAHITELVASHGALNISAEKVADSAVDALRRYQSSTAPVGHYLADQLLLPLALGAGGSFITGKLTEHCRTNMNVIRQLLAVSIDTEEVAQGWRVTVET
ncbi:RNA 3'-terminal phosphate cyclase [Methylovulum psychrotolerans]|uniref:RNA 3'-terminal phosphate cyclase n=1 Tax=Methylovulum psychrotolerans TaxID=1704499 RepID=A0A1Z4BU27_9GAMM|nr:RNA 3'-terminal phosphate cyclase [Methylovulum psychrotolerans]ASF44807.1 RNA 3'-phosphate cyclase [Methylovulum psychrotolerans]